MKRFIVPILIAIGGLLFVLVLSSPLASMEEQITALRYRVRGEQRADSNIVIVYIDNDAINDLGWPVRRNYHALMINALADLKVKVVGIDVLFEHPSLEYPEYDELLQHVVASGHNVVLSSSFGNIESAKSVNLQTARPQSSEMFDYPFVGSPGWYGTELHLPMAPLPDVAQGIGHENVTEDNRLPLFVWQGNEPVPLFGLELLRAYCSADRKSVRYESNTFVVKDGDRLIEIVSDDGAVSLHYPGRMTSFTAYPFLEVLKSYDALRTGRTATIPVEHFRNKIVLVGVIAPGRTATYSTPVDPRFPPLGLHAVFLDNALRSGFLHMTPSWVVYLMCFVIGLGCAASALLLKSSARIIIPLGLLVFVLTTSFALFVASNSILPVASCFIVGFIATTTAFFHKHRFLGQQLKSVQSEKEKIVGELRDKEAKVAMLEREFVSLESKKSADRTNELLDEIRRYKAEIHSLAAKKDDMEDAVVENDAILSGMKEFEGMVYEAGGALQPIVEFIPKIAGSDATVLILGESGTGKEMVARAIHKRSGRVLKSFIAVNCGALAESLLESELFGHEKGAFTGAVKDKPGRFELADGGTIFLDEIGEVNEAFQLKLLRVLQEGEFERVGGTKTIRVNVRVVAATNKELKTLVNEKRFREDLFYRLNVLAIELPPLRERQADIPLLITHFLRKEEGKITVSKNVLDTLQSYAWRGNIRELESVVTRAVLLAKADKRTMISMKDLSDEIASAAKGAIAIDDQILESLREKGFSRSAISETADELGGLNRGTVAEYLRGQCLKAFVEHTYNRDTAVRYIALSSDNAVNDRVRKKLDDYLANIADAVDSAQPWDSVKLSLKPKTKNLPQKYHPYLEQVAEAFYRRVWKLVE